MGPSQTERVIKAARSYRGVCRVDFMAPDVVDGGPPILNFPGRMFDAERAGHSFEMIGKRHGCKVFRLIDVERDAAPSPPDDETDPSPSGGVSLNTEQDDEPALFEAAAESIPHWRQDAA